VGKSVVLDKTRKKPEPKSRLMFDGLQLFIFFSSATLADVFITTVYHIVSACWTVHYEVPFPWNTFISLPQTVQRALSFSFIVLATRIL